MEDRGLRNGAKFLRGGRRVGAQEGPFSRKHNLLFIFQSGCKLPVALVYLGLKMVVLLYSITIMC